MRNLYFPFELLAALAVYTFVLERRNGFWLRLLLSGGGGLFVICLLLKSGNFYYNDRLFVEETVSVSIVVTIVICLLLFGYSIMIVWSSFCVSLQEAVYCAACAYLTEHIAYCIRLLINDSIEGKQPAEAGSLPYLFVHILVCLISYFAFAKRMIQEKHYATSAIRSLGLMVCVLFLVAGMSIVATVYEFEQIHGIYALLCCILVLYSQVKQQNQLSLQEELHVQEQLWVKHKAQYEMSKETIEIINRKCHDLKHQVAALKTIHNPEQQQKAINSIEDSVMIYDSILKTGNEILDTVLTEKSVICSQNHIILNCIADGKVLNFMDAVDLYTLFGNALDNAMEGVRNLKDEERFITLLLHEKAGLILIQIENRFEGEIKMQEGIPMTKKKEKEYHGYGISSIIHTVEKYQGFVTIETENKIFLLRITIPAAAVSGSGRKIL